MSGGVVGDGSPTGRSGVCLNCGHSEDCHGFSDDPLAPRLCDVEVSDHGDLDCACPGLRLGVASSSGTGHDAALEPQLGDIVAVRTADGFWIRKIAMSLVMNGGDFPVVWVEWEGDDVSDGGAPWPSEDVRPLSEHPDALTREAFRGRKEPRDVAQDMEAIYRREIEILHGRLDVALTERQQDKERIERLETAIRWMMALPKDSRRDMKATGRAALAVEEDAE